MKKVDFITVGTFLTALCLLAIATPSHGADKKGGETCKAALADSAKDAETAKSSQVKKKAPTKTAAKKKAPAKKTAATEDLSNDASDLDLSHLDVVELAAEAKAAAKDQPMDLESILSQVEDSLPKVDNVKLTAQKFSLLDLVNSDPTSNLAVKSPFIVMNAAQRMLSMINDAGTEEVWTQKDGHVTLYKLFSEGGEATNGRLLVGAHSAIQSFVENIKAQARGDRSGAYPVMLIGSHGTGKSEFLSVLRAAQVYYTTQEKNDDFALYSYQWKNLSTIEDVAHRAKFVEMDGKLKEVPLAAPMSSSPFTILPAAAQKYVMDMTTDRVSELTGGLDMAPVMEPDPQSEALRNGILAYYTREENGGKPLSPAQQVQYLSKHIDVVRLVPTHGAMPVVGAQGKEIDREGLFMSVNAAVRLTEGATDPFAWFLNGKVLQGEGNMVLFDEFLRNSPELRNMLLGVFESRVIDLGGMPETPFDTVMIAATNTANLLEVKDEAYGTGDAGLDRFTFVDLRWPTHPSVISKTLLYMQQSAGLKQQKLAQENTSEDDDAPFVNQNEVTKPNLKELFPYGKPNEAPKTPDYRYALSFKSSQGDIHVAPHTITFMSELIAATRMITDSKKASQLFPAATVIKTLPFKDPVARIRVYSGESQISDTQMQELNKLSQLLIEGESGIGARDAGKWMTQVIAEATRPGNNNTITPGLAHKVFKKMIDTGAIKSPNNKTRLDWIRLSMRIVQERLFEKLNNDVMGAIADSNDRVNQAYLEVFGEITERYRDPQATTYIHPVSQQPTTIDTKRLEKIKDLYKKTNGMPLAEEQIAMYHAGVNRRPVEDTVHPQLHETITQYYASIATELVSIDALIQASATGKGSHETMSKLETLMNNLRRLGYNEDSAHMALQMIKSVRNYKAQVEKLEAQQQ